jgi:hypothetical protein
MLKPRWVGFSRPAFATSFSLVDAMGSGFFQPACAGLAYAGHLKPAEAG